VNCKGASWPHRPLGPVKPPFVVRVAHSALVVAQTTCDIDICYCFPGYTTFDSIQCAGLNDPLGAVPFIRLTIVVVDGLMSPPDVSSVQVALCSALVECHDVRNV
jgi:hypothetical protein